MSDMLKTYRLDESTVAAIDILAKRYRSRGNVIALAIGMLQGIQPLDSDDEMLAEPRKMSGLKSLVTQPLSLDAVAEPGKGKVSFERPISAAQVKQREVFGRERKPLLKPSERKK